MGDDIDDDWPVTPDNLRYEVDEVYKCESEKTDVVMASMLGYEELKCEVTASDDPVNHPKHYTSHPSGIECIDITRHMGFNLGNALKYIWRADLKSDNPIQDLEKAIWYLKDEIRKRGGNPDGDKD